MKFLIILISLFMLLGCSTKDEGNGTAPLNLCSLIVSSQTTNPSNEWLELNCDNDCFLNGTELDLGTNPLVPDFTKIGSNLNFISIVGSNFVYIFDSTGTQFLEARNPNFGAITSRYDYVNDNLVRVRLIEPDQGVVYGVIFNYSGNQIDQIDRYGPLINVEYTGNLITSSTENILTPPGLFMTNIDTDPDSHRVLNCQKYEWISGSQYNYFTYVYQYDASKDNLLRRDVEQSRYDSSNGEYEFIEGYTEEYSYYEDTLNPAYEAFDNFFIHTLLVDNSESYFKIGDSYLQFLQTPMISKNLIESYTKGSTQKQFITDLCASEDGIPRIIFENPNYEGRIFNYSN